MSVNGRISAWRPDIRQKKYPMLSLFFSKLVIFKPVNVADLVIVDELPDLCAVPQLRLVQQLVHLLLAQPRCLQLTQRSVRRQALNSQAVILETFYWWTHWLDRRLKCWLNIPYWIGWLSHSFVLFNPKSSKICMTKFFELQWLPHRHEKYKNEDDKIRNHRRRHPDILNIPTWNPENYPSSIK